MEVGGGPHCLVCRRRKIIFIPHPHKAGGLHKGSLPASFSTSFTIGQSQTIPGHVSEILEFITAGNWSRVHNSTHERIIGYNQHRSSSIRARNSRLLRVVITVNSVRRTIHPLGPCRADGNAFGWHERFWRYLKYWKKIIFSNLSWSVDFMFTHPLPESIVTGVVSTASACDTRVVVHPRTGTHRQDLWMMRLFIPILEFFPPFSSPAHEVAVSPLSVLEIDYRNSIRFR